MHGQCCRGRYVDCVRFVDAVWMALHRLELPDLPVLPAACSLHTSAGAIQMARTFHERYPLRQVRLGELEPGDGVVFRLGAAYEGHIALVGWQPGTLWHADRHVGVSMTGVGLAHEHGTRAWRPERRAEWRPR